MEVLMKNATLTTRLNAFANRVLDVLVPDVKPNIKTRSGREPSRNGERSQRKDFPYYMVVLDDDTREMVGHLADISTGGFKLDTRKPVPINQDFRFRMQVPGEVSDKHHIAFSARSRWCKTDPMDPFIYNVGYQLIGFAPEDLGVFARMMEKYGKECQKRTLDLRRSNKW
jgi:hypothetical protein